MREGVRGYGDGAAHLVAAVIDEVRFEGEGWMVAGQSR
jgi:hypothetical protein